MRSVNGRTALITGGAGGIGQGIAIAFANAGMKVALADLDAERLSRAHQALKEEGVSVMTAVLDVVDLAAWEAVADNVERVLGPIGVLCNNAGIGGSARLCDDAPERWRLTIEVNVIGTFNGCKVLLPRMLARADECHIVNTASLGGLRGNPGMPAYSASKYAVVGLTDCLRLEIAGTRVRVSVVYPGMTRTNLASNSARISAERAGVSPTSESKAIDALVQQRGMKPERVGERILKAVLGNEYHVFTHADWRPVIEAVFADRLSAIGQNADPDYSEDISSLMKLIDSPVVVE